MSEQSKDSASIHVRHSVVRWMCTLPLWRCLLLGGAVALLASLLTMVVAFVVPRLRNVLGIVPLVPQQWALIGGIALTLLLAV